MKIGVNALLARLGALLTASLGTDPGVQQVQLARIPDTPDSSQAQTVLGEANLEILAWLARAGRELGVAYELGRELRDTADPPLPRHGTVRDALLAQLSRSRVSWLQSWLFILSSYLAAGAAALVSVSVGRWSDLITTVFDTTSPGRLRGTGGQPQTDVADELARSLLPQGEVWINVLIGAEVDPMPWAVTPDLGKLRFNNAGVRELRRSGIPPSARWDEPGNGRPRG